MLPCPALDAVIGTHVTAYLTDGSTLVGQLDRPTYGEDGRDGHTHYTLTNPSSHVTLLDIIEVVAIEIEPA